MSFKPFRVKLFLKFYLCLRLYKFSFPGPYVKWFLEAVGPSGLHRMLHGFEDKTAIAVCTVAYVDREGSTFLFSGETRGVIVEPTVEETFGWDSCFKPDGYNITYAQMPKEEKNLISHRRKAMLKLKEHLDNIAFH